MTTSTKITETETTETETTETTETETKERDLDTLLQLSYSEMTEDEIERVIDYRAGVKAHEETFAKQLEAIESASQALKDAAKEKREQAQQAQNELLELSLARLRSAYGEETK